MDYIKEYKDHNREPNPYSNYYRNGLNEKRIEILVDILLSREEKDIYERRCSEELKEMSEMVEKIETVVIKQLRDNKK